MDATHTPEEWRPVVGFEGEYEVSNLGRVRSVDRIVVGRDGKRYPYKGQIRKPSPVPRTGHLKIRLGRGGRVAKSSRYVHQLVMQAFVGPRPNGLEVCHNNGEAADNRIWNLRYDTDSANVQDMIAHGKHYFARKTHCKRGHEFTPENTYKRPKQRQCRVCRREQGRVYDKGRRVA